MLQYSWFLKHMCPIYKVPVQRIKIRCTISETLDKRKGSEKGWLTQQIQMEREKNNDKKS